MTPFGDRAARFPIPQTARRPLLDALASVPGVAGVVLAEEIGCVVFAEGPDRDVAERRVAEVLAAPPSAAAESAGATHRVRVVYDGEDLAAVAHAVGRSTADVVQAHAEAEYRVAMLGFLPGFGYLRGLPSMLTLPRRPPRPRVPPGSVAIAAEYTGIYPCASPGGWHLLGRTDFDAFGPDGATMKLGDIVRFVPVDEVAQAPRVPAPLAPVAGPHLEIVRAAGIALFIDGGRAGRMHEGIPPGGPLVGRAHARANAHAGNESGTCALEIAGTLEVVARGGTVQIADEDGAVALRADARHVVSTAGRARVRYLAIEGGFDAPLVLGSRSTLLGAGIGAPLRKGDRIGGLAKTARSVPRAMAERSDRIVVLPGPDRPPGFAIEALDGCELRIAPASDRTGTRLEGFRPEVDPVHLRGPSLPMVLGAIELTPSGLIVLGPDHPTTGGYPVVAVVASASLDDLFVQPIGATVRFAVAFGA